MNHAEIMTRARHLLDHHGLADWQVQFDTARRRAGCCFFQRKTISLSGVLLREYPPEAVDEVILHEIAHALVGPTHGHDATWKATASLIGATPRASLAGSLPSPEAPWVGTCPACGTARHLFRSPRRVVSCGRCSRRFDIRYVLSWTLHGKPTIPGGAYLQQWSKLRKVAS